MTERTASADLIDEVCVLGCLLEARALEMPEHEFAHFEDGTTWTYAQALDLVRQTALSLSCLGVKSGDYVNLWLPNCADAVRLWFAINYLGAVCVPLNIAFRGLILRHVLATSPARLIVAHAGLVDRLAEVDCASLEDIVVLGGSVTRVGDLRVHDAAKVAPAVGVPPPRVQVRPWDPQMVIYTSGTTGPSKGVIVPYFHLYSSIMGAYGYLRETDRFLVNLPLFHMTGAGSVMVPLYLGGSFAMVTSFRTAEFWSVVRSTRSTSVILIGAMTRFLLNQPAAADDREHTLRSAMMAPLTKDAAQFTRRFGVEIYTAYGMTEISCPLRAGPNAIAGSSGKPRPGVEVRLVDENDCEVAPGTIGELIVRTDTPWTMNSGYLGDPEATARAWRNGWFHTGDAFRRDAVGNYYFIDRIKDAIRRRGENISSYEVESAVATHPSIREVAAIAIPSEHGEDDVLVAVSLKQGARADAAEIINHVMTSTAHFMVPRYVRFLDELPRTPTQKVMKQSLRDAGVTLDTFDREKSDIRVRATRL